MNEGRNEREVMRTPRDSGGGGGKRVRGGASERASLNMVAGVVATAPWQGGEGGRRPWSGRLSAAAAATAAATTAAAGEMLLLSVLWQRALATRYGRRGRRRHRRRRQRGCRSGPKAGAAASATPRRSSELQNCSDPLSHRESDSLQPRLPKSPRNGGEGGWSRAADRIAAAETRAAMN